MATRKLSGLVQIPWILRFLRRLWHPKTQKLCGKRRISITFPSRKKIKFCSKSHFSQYFSILSTRQGGDIHDLGRPAASCPFYCTVQAEIRIWTILPKSKSLATRTWRAPTVFRPAIDFIEPVCQKQYRWDPLEAF